MGKELEHGSAYSDSSDKRVELHLGPTLRQILVDHFNEFQNFIQDTFVILNTWFTPNILTQTSDIAKLIKFTTNYESCVILI